MAGPRTVVGVGDVLAVKVEELHTTSVCRLAGIRSANEPDQGGNVRVNLGTVFFRMHMHGSII